MGVFLEDSTRIEDYVKEVNKYRIANGLVALKIKIRKCLGCNTEFKSTHKRLCDRCTRNSHKDVQEY